MSLVTDTNHARVEERECGFRFCCCLAAVFILTLFLLSTLQLFSQSATRRGTMLLITPRKQ